MLNGISHRLPPSRGAVNFIWAQLYAVVNNHERNSRRRVDSQSAAGCSPQHPAIGSIIILVPLGGSVDQSDRTNSGMWETHAQPSVPGPADGLPRGLPQTNLRPSVGKPERLLSRSYWAYRVEESRQSLYEHQLGQARPLALTPTRLRPGRAVCLPTWHGKVPGESGVA